MKISRILATGRGKYCYFEGRNIGPGAAPRAFYELYYHTRRHFRQQKCYFRCQNPLFRRLFWSFFRTTFGGLFRYWGHCWATQRPGDCDHSASRPLPMPYIQFLPFVLVPGSSFGANFFNFRQIGPMRMQNRTPKGRETQTFSGPLAPRITELVFMKGILIIHRILKLLYPRCDPHRRCAWVYSHLDVVF